MEQTNNTNNSKVVWLTIVFVLLAVGLWSFMGGSLSSLLLKKEAPKQEAPKTEELSIDRDLMVLEGRADFPKVTVKSSVKSNVKELDTGLGALILSEAISPEVTKVTYGDGVAGWSIVYQYTDNVMNVYNKLYSAVRNNKFEIGLASRTFGVAIISAENSNYKVKVVSQHLTDSSALVKITVIKN